MRITKEERISLVLALVAAVSAGSAYLKRDAIFTWRWQELRGEWHPEPSAELAQKAIDFAETKNPGAACVGRWIGRDDTYLYLALGCGRFTERLGAVVADGDQNFLAARFRYEEKEVTGLERNTEGQFRNSLRRLFPKVAGEKMLLLRDRDLYLKSGYERSTMPGAPVGSP